MNKSIRVNFCHNCQHARSTRHAILCARGLKVVWQWPTDGGTLDYGFRAKNGCPGSFERRRANYYKLHGATVEKRAA